MTSQAQTGGPGGRAIRAGVGGPGQAEIPAARTVKDRRARAGGPPGRSRMKVGAA
jgi:hypothetical protein